MAHHFWKVVGTTISEEAIIVECEVCGARGAVLDPTSTELETAKVAHKPGRDQVWTSPKRVQTLCDERAPSSSKHEHVWEVYAVKLDERQIMVRCRTCKCLGAIEEPNTAEFDEAFRRSSKPYQWEESDRVTVAA